MSKDPAFLFYPGDWLGGTLTFSRSHKGAYMDLLVAQFNNGRLTLDDIQTILGPDFLNMWENKLKAKFKVDKNGLFYNEKLDFEVNKRKKFTESRRSNLKSKPHKDTHMKPHMENEDENENKSESEVIILPSFQNFWDAYDKKVGSKEKLEKKWDKLSQKDKEKIMVYIPHYIEAQPEKKFRKNPETFFNNKSWNDELISANGRKFNAQELLGDLQE